MMKQRDLDDKFLEDNGVFCEKKFSTCESLFSTRLIPLDELGLWRVVEQSNASMLGPEELKLSLKPWTAS